MKNVWNLGIKLDKTWIWTILISNQNCTAWWNSFRKLPKWKTFRILPLNWIELDSGHSVFCYVSQSVSQSAICEMTDGFSENFFAIIVHRVPKKMDPFVFPQFLHQILLKFQNQGQFWNLHVLSFPKLSLILKFDKL